ncbi:MAG: hypothetical protein LBR29_05805 [Methylobacteriaceae bacterium]|nr:hypothetical protein [Methylobacteriaceae bacterium]
MSPEKNGESSVNSGNQGFVVVDRRLFYPNVLEMACILGAPLIGIALLALFG